VGNFGDALRVFRNEPRGRRSSLMVVAISFTAVACPVERTIANSRPPAVRSTSFAEAQRRSLSAGLKNFLDTSHQANQHKGQHRG